MQVAIRPHYGDDLLEVFAISHRFVRLPRELAGEFQAAQRNGIPLAIDVEGQGFRRLG